eukprot:TRINITY_DN50299_c0_g1_i1.p1 TRINITY_DN50299_c0_g1~~TRINITY_DN50299_c0_g1_i1.p1  ORF type:complete len:935 (+),score=433.42 TRINITY_DN50299_c0_g1_i1:45-2849(+)
MSEYEDQGAISGLWRSEDMELRRMCIERSVLEKVVRRFGNIGCVQFRDMNAHEYGEDGSLEVDADARHERCFVSQVRTCESVERCLRYFEEQLTAFDVPVVDTTVTTNGERTPLLSLQVGAISTGEPPLGIDEFRDNRENFSDLPNALETLSSKLTKDEQSLKEQCDKLSAYRAELSLTKDKSAAMDWAETWARDSFMTTGETATSSRILDVQEGAHEMHGFSGQLIGTIGTDRMMSLQRLLHRVSKGYSQVVSQPMNEASNKTIFRIIYSSSEVQARILKLTVSLGATLLLGRVLAAPDGRADPRTGTLVNLPDHEAGFRQLREATLRDIDDRTKVIASTEGLILDNLRSIARVHTERRHYVLREKAMYHTLNMIQIDKGTSFANAVAWVPRRKLYLVEQVLGDYQLCSLGQDDLKADCGESPPTHFETTEFTGTFQGIVDSYGIPRYHEVNPAIFTIVTFPWLFGIMYGDVGHGIMITLSAAIMILMQDKLKKLKLNEIVDMVFGARWLLLLMGLFATYQGFLYNDTFSLMLGYGPTRYRWPDGWEDALEYKTNNLSDCYKGDSVIPIVCGECHMSDVQTVRNPVTGEERCTCPSELDFFNKKAPDGWICPMWINGTFNTLQPSNGPTPFGFDVSWHDTDNKLTYYNSFKMKNAVIVGVLQMTLGLFLSLSNHLYFKDHKRIFFGFIPEMVFLFCSFGYMCLMLILKWIQPWENAHTAPNILETMTNFFLSPGKYNYWLDDDGVTVESNGYEYLYSGQPDLQTVLVIICVIAVPFMLFPIPVIVGREKKRQDEEAERMGTAPSTIDMQEVWIRQVIHTIEYVLGCVSNTASYLRLWALSLAHAELSEVFWNFAIMKMLSPAKGVGGGFIFYFGWGAWFSATLGVLVVMEALSAFLHSLRLHWVEFQNKFYVGDGTKFTPLDFKVVIEEAEQS